MPPLHRHYRDSAIRICIAALRISLIFPAVLFSGRLGAQAPSAQTVYARVSPSVVRIQDGLSSGSGVVVSSDGLILTNYHVADGVLPLKVQAMVRISQKFEEQTFDTVELVGVHQVYDLALIRIRTTGRSFIPARFRPSPIPTGSACFAIGNPGPATLNLKNTITQGIISAAVRQIENKVYIQYDAATNPGNSGGALCDQNGSVFGIVTFGIAKTQGLNFAIPTAGLDLKKFQPVNKRPVDPEAAKEFLMRANETLSQATNADGDALEELLSTVYSYQKQALHADPRDPSIYYQIGKTYRLMNRSDLASSFFEAALRIDPHHPGSCAELGKMVPPARAEKLWETCLSGGKDPSAMATSATNLAALYLRKNDPPRAVYLIHWAGSLAAAETSEEQDTRRQVTAEILPKLPERQYVEIRNKTTPFSLDDMENFVTSGNSKLAPPSPSSNPTSKTAPTPDHSPAPETDISIPLAIDKESNDALTNLILDAASSPIAGTITAMPDAAANVIPACGGAYLVISFLENDKLGIFDVLHCRFASFIPNGGTDFMYAAGGRRLLIYKPQSETAELWDVPSGKMITSRRIKFSGKILGIGMGLMNSDSAVLALRSNVSDGTLSFGLLDLNQWELKIPDGDFHGMKIPNDASPLEIHIIPNAVCSMFLAWIGDDSAHAAHVTTRGYQWEVARIGTSGQYSADSSLILSRDGAHLPDGRLIEGVPPALATAPIFGLRAYLHIDSTGAPTIRGVANHQVMASIQTPSRTLDTPGNVNLPQDIWYFASRFTNRLVQVRRNEVIVLPLPPLDSKIIATSDSGPSNMAIPGTEFSRPIDLPNPESVTIEDAPAGFQWDIKERTLRWKVPKDTAPGVAEVLLSYRRVDGMPDYEIIKITVH